MACKLILELLPVRCLELVELFAFGLEYTIILVLSIILQYSSSILAPIAQIIPSFCLVGPLSQPWLCREVDRDSVNPKDDEESHWQSV